MADKPRTRTLPINELDFNSMLSNPLWGQDWENPEMRELLKNTKIKTDEHGAPLYHEEIKEMDGKKVTYRYLIAEEKSEYETLSFLTRDFRVGNISRMGGDYDYCKRWTKISHGCLQLGLKVSHVLSLAKVATVLELSQSINGFFRKEANSLYEHLEKTEETAKRRSLFAGNKKKGGV